MNEEQKAVLTEEQRNWLEWAAGEVIAHRDWADRTVLALTALADARLEVAALQGHAADSWRRKVVRLDAEVARLTEERDALTLARKLTGVEHGQDHEELDQQREDIRRLMEKGKYGDA